MYYDVDCPYCDRGLQINHDDGQGYEEGVTHQQECDHCGKTFVFTTSISFDYYAQKADCLNDAVHSWKLTKTYPECFSRMRCEMCDDERELNDEERKEYNIQTREEYFEQLNKDKL